MPTGLATGCKGWVELVEIPGSLARGVSHDLHSSLLVQLYAWHFWHLISINVGVALSSLGLRLGRRLAGPSEEAGVGVVGGGAPWEAPLGLGLACPLPLPLPFDPWDGADRRLRIQAISSLSSWSSWSTIHLGGVLRCLFTCVHSPIAGRCPGDRQTPGEVCPRRQSQCVIEVC